MTTSEPVRILVCGSRTYNTRYVMHVELDTVSSFYSGNVLIIEGEAKGADLMAREWAEMNDKPFEPYPADWKTYGKRAGFLRNTQMLEEGQPDRLVAFVDKPLDESRGTKMMVDIARTAGVPCRVVEHRAYVLPPLQKD